MVGLADGKRIFGLSPTPIPPSAMPAAIADAPIQSVFEVALAGGEVMNRLATTISTQGGALLAIDYGYSVSQTGETLQGVRRHAYADVLESPGDTDLSAHVDFEALGNVARNAGLAVPPLLTQGEFLDRLGMGERAKALSLANPGSASDIAAARKRLTAPDQMGELFKVFCATSPGLSPPGFAA
jgi:SAM-dependent MidA family methyltransferase